AYLVWLGPKVSVTSTQFTRRVNGWNGSASALKSLSSTVVRALASTPGRLLSSAAISLAEALARVIRVGCEVTWPVTGSVWLITMRSGKKPFTDCTGAAGGGA